MPPAMKAAQKGKEETGLDITVVNPKFLHWPQLTSMVPDLSRNY